LDSLKIIPENEKYYKYGEEIKEEVMEQSEEVDRVQKEEGKIHVNN
jgi:hypothetical protein